MYKVREILKEKLDIQEYYHFPNKSLFTTLEWIAYLSEDIKGKPCILRITDDNIREVGCVQVSAFALYIDGAGLLHHSIIVMNILQSANSL